MSRGKQIQSGQLKQHLWVQAAWAITCAHMVGQSSPGLACSFSRAGVAEKKGANMVGCWHGMAVAMVKQWCEWKRQP